MDVLTPAETERALYAKSPTRSGRQLTLEQHLVDTEEAAVLLFRPGSRWAHRFLQFHRLVEDGYSRFVRHLRVAALFHDLGKANDDFLRAVSGHRVRQTVRHEHLSTLLLHHPDVAKWLRRTPDLDLDVVAAAVLTHHLKASESGDFAFAEPRHAPSVRLIFGHPSLHRVLERVGRILDLPEPPRVTEDDRFPDSAWLEVKTAVLRAARSFGRERDRNRRAFGWALKSALIAADSVASAMFREDRSIAEWIDAVAHAPPVTGEDVAQAILHPRARSIESRAGRFELKRFQAGASRLGRRALLVAGCGAGKTLAAWKWIEARMNEAPAGRALFLYPTRGAATEGFRDYVGWAPEGEGALVHGTAGWELEAMRDNPPDSLRGKTLDDDAAGRLFALGLWPKRYFSATVDQFLAFLENRYASLCLVPALADSVVVLDEVHSYDRSMFANLVAFLREFDLPVLAMTATLPRGRVEQIRNLGFELYPDKRDRATLADLEAAETHPRYRITHVDDPEAALSMVRIAVARGLRVLWVVNVVSRCQDLAQRLRADLEVPVLAYHSRFRLMDRRRAHAETIEAFQTGTGAQIAVTTQVCEMSLDLDADVLVTEHAPVSSLVQRFGRANRHLRHGKGFRADLLPYPAASAAPYEPMELECAAAFLASLPTEPSQRDLALALERHSPPERVAPPDAGRFLSGGYFAVPGDLRDVDDHGTAVVLDSDLEDVVEARRRRQPIDGWLLTVPHRHVREADPRIPAWLRIADGRAYHPDLGFLTSAAAPGEVPLGSEG